VVPGAEFIRRTCKDSFCDIGAPSLIIRTTALKQAGLLREELVRTNDFEMYLRLATFGDVASTNRVLGIRRLHQAQISKPYDEYRVLDFKEHELGFASFFAHEGATMADAKELEALSRRRSGDYSYWYGMWQLLRGYPDAKAAFAFAAERRAVPKWLPPIPFLFRKRWLLSLWRAVRRRWYPPTPLPSSFEVPAYR
jgi:hypothetical protein